jgi:hypothetical protein
MPLGISYPPITAELTLGWIIAGMALLAETKWFAPGPRARGLWACLGPRARRPGAVAPRHDESLCALAEAFERVTEHSGTELSAALLERQSEIDVAVTMYALRSLVGLASRQTGETPRGLLRAEFFAAPGDDFWRPEVTVPEQYDRIEREQLLQGASLASGEGGG